MELVERTNWKVEDLSYTPEILKRTEAVIRFYTGDGYQIINHAFRHNIRPAIQNTFLKYALKVAVYNPEEIILYRGCGESETYSLLRSLENNDRTLDYEFPMSTSLFIHVATRFVDEVNLFRAEYSTYVEYSAILAIRIPIGTPVIYAGAFSSCDDEYEVILPPRTILYIENVKKDFDEEDLRVYIKVHARAEVDLREFDEEYVDEDLVADWARRAGVNLELE